MRKKARAISPLPPLSVLGFPHTSKNFAQKMDKLSSMISGAGDIGGVDSSAGLGTGEGLRDTDPSLTESSMEP